MLFSRRRQPSIWPGTRFRGPENGMMISTAQVIEVQSDARGIPHVHFELTVSAPSGHGKTVGMRILSLERFTATFTEPLPA